MSAAEKQQTIDVRNALFAAADGKPFGSVMNGIIMAQAKLAAEACKGNPDETRANLAYYHAIMMEAVPIYCEEMLTGHQRSQTN